MIERTEKGRCYIHKATHKEEGGKEGVPTRGDAFGGGPSGSACFTSRAGSSVICTTSASGSGSNFGSAGDFGFASGGGAGFSGSGVAAFAAFGMGKAAATFGVGAAAFLGLTTDAKAAFRSLRPRMMACSLEA